MRKHYTAQFKAQVVQELLKEKKTLNQSDTPGKAGGLMSVTASKAVVLLNRQSGMSKEPVVCKALEDRTGLSVSQRLYGRFTIRHKVIPNGRPR